MDVSLKTGLISLALGIGILLFTVYDIKDKKHYKSSADLAYNIGGIAFGVISIGIGLYNLYKIIFE